MKQARRIALVAIALALAVIGMFAVVLALPAGSSVALAQAAATATPTASATTSPTVRPGVASTAPVTSTSNIGNTFWQGLAAKLGINVDTLKAQALQQRKDMIDQAVKDGRLTQDRADQIKQRLTADNLIAPINIGPDNRRGVSPNLPNRNFGPRFGMGGSPAVLEAVAKVLNLAPSNLLTQLGSGKSLADIATAQKVDQAAVKQAIIDTRTAEIDRAVTDGFITQAQGAALKANLTPDKIDLSRPQFSFR